MNFCPQCGARIAQPGRFCTSCGTQLTPPEGAPPPAAAAPPARPIPETGQGYQPDAGVAVVEGGGVPRPLIILGVIALGLVALVVALGIMDRQAATPDASPSAIASIGSADPLASASAVASEPAKPAIDPANLLTANGVMGIMAGQPFSAVSSRFDPKGTYGDAAENCEIYNSLNGRISAMVEDGAITSISTQDRAFRTPSDIGVGSTLAQLKSAYGARLTSEENPYDGRDYFVSAGNGNGIKFHVAGNVVTTIALGGSSIRYVEGCL